MERSKGHITNVKCCKYATVKVNHSKRSRGQRSKIRPLKYTSTWIHHTCLLGFYFSTVFSPGCHFFADISREQVRSGILLSRHWTVLTLGTFSSPRVILLSLFLSFFFVCLRLKEEMIRTKYVCITEWFLSHYLNRQDWLTRSIIEFFQDKVEPFYSRICSAIP